MGLPPIISVDDHLIEPRDLWERRLPRALRDRGPRVVRIPWEYGPGRRQNYRPAASGDNAADFWVVEDIYQGIPLSGASAGYTREEIVDRPFTFEEMRPGCYDVKARLADMDAVNIERSLCFPNSIRFCGQLFLWMNDKTLAFECVKAYHDWVVEEWAGESGGRLLPLCIIPLWDPAAAAAEVRRNAARGVRAVCFSELPAQLGLPSIHDADGYWMPFLRACEETQTVICIHIGSSSTIPSTSPDAPFAVMLAATSFNSQLAMADWLLSGHLARFPSLKLAFSESQIGWMPYVFERVDRIWRTQNGWSKVDPLLTEPPSSYVAGRVYGCFFEDDFGLRARADVGVDQITFECDYPHQDSTWPDTASYVERVMAGVDDTDRYKILRGNAIRLLGLPEDRPGTNGRPLDLAARA